MLVDQRGSTRLVADLGVAEKLDHRSERGGLEGLRSRLRGLGDGFERAGSSLKRARELRAQPFDAQCDRVRADRCDDQSLQAWIVRRPLEEPRDAVGGSLVANALFVGPVVWLGRAGDQCAT
jgi:hypothetical protein